MSCTESDFTATICEVVPRPPRTEVSMLPEDRTLPAVATPGRRGSVALLAVAALFATQLSATAATSARGSAWTSAALDPGLSLVGDALQDVIVTARGGAEAAADAVRRI